MSYLDPAKGKTATQGVRLAAKACARCIASRIHDQSGALAVPNRITAQQTAPRLFLRTPMPTQPRQVVPR